MPWNKKISTKNSKLLKIFLVVSAITAIVCGGILGIGVLAYNEFIYQEEPTKPPIVAEGDDKDTVDGDKDNEDLAVEEEVLDNDLEEEEVSVLNKTVAVIGKDDTASLTDVILVVNFNSETNEAHVISVPRDTHVVWNESQKAYLKHAYRWTETSKLTEMSSMGGIENIRGTTLNYLETLLGVAIDNYVIVSTSAFVDIVDAIDGVEVNVPQRMKYDDYSQGLHIDLYPGEQVLNGEQAEGFVRYRDDYVMGDLDRIEVQQIFMEAFIEQVTSPSIIMKIPSITNVVFNSVKTDVKLTEIPEYIPYVTTFDTEKLYFHTVPGSTGRIEGRDVYLIDEEATDELVASVFGSN